MPGPTHAPSSAASPGALRGENHLQHFVGIFKEFAELIALCAQRLCGQLRRHLDSGDRGIFRHVADFIHFDTGVSAERGF
jgi:hypothetical protein